MTLHTPSSGGVFEKCANYVAANKFNLATKLHATLSLYISTYVCMCIKYYNNKGNSRNSYITLHSTDSSVSRASLVQAATSFELRAPSSSIYFPYPTKSHRAANHQCAELLRILKLCENLFCQGKGKAPARVAGFLQSLVAGTSTTPAVFESPSPLLHNVNLD